MHGRIEDAEQREVEFPVGADDAGADNLLLLQAWMEDELHFRGAAHHMLVGEIDARVMDAKRGAMLEPAGDLDERGRSLGAPGDLRQRRLLGVQDRGDEEKQRKPDGATHDGRSRERWCKAMARF